MLYCMLETYLHRDLTESTKDHAIQEASERVCFPPFYPWSSTRPIYSTPSTHMQLSSTQHPYSSKWLTTPPSPPLQRTHNNIIRLK